MCLTQALLRPSWYFMVSKGRHSNAIIRYNRGTRARSGDIWSDPRYCRYKQRRSARDVEIYKAPRSHVLIEGTSRAQSANVAWFSASTKLAIDIHLNHFPQLYSVYFSGIGRENVRSQLKTRLASCWSFEIMNQNSFQNNTQRTSESWNNERFLLGDCWNNERLRLRNPAVCLNW